MHFHQMTNMDHGFINMKESKMLENNKDLPREQERKGVKHTGINFQLRLVAVNCKKELAVT